METISKYSNLLTRFSHANCILKYYGNYSEVKSMMSILCYSTKQQWDNNISAYQYGLCEYKANLLELTEPLTDQIIDFLAAKKSLHRLHLRLSIQNDEDIDNLSKLLEKVDCFVRFSEIMVPKEFYNQKYELLLKLTDLLKRHKISETGINTNEIVSKFINSPIPWIQNYNFDETSISQMQGIGKLIISRQKIIDGKFNEFKDLCSMPVKELEISPFHHPTEFAKISFPYSLLMTVNKIKVNFSTDDYNPQTFDVISNLEPFKCDEIVYKVVQFVKIQKMVQFISKACTMSRRLSVSFCQFITFEGKIFIENPTVIFRHGDSFLKMKGDRFILCASKNEKEVAKIGNSFIFKDMKYSHMFGARNFDFEPESFDVDIPQDTVGVTDYSSACYEITSEYDKIIPLKKLPIIGKIKIIINLLPKYKEKNKRLIAFTEILMKNKI